ncbi:TIGR01212 family radical SAM protein [Thermospira aquatica]|uniref:TIGR01212 family radical SAM protein n=1 Tax=Thermospira aquatica TaxID=2828656 RepID=A0AAX3BF04_9SPIR|nr:TIGR01212 family radical SAM protein [Thermospira aquatica]URA10659.1 TIGR01212 family radical SAM protein [Thermospira aquatica]
MKEWKGRPYHALKVYLESRFGKPVKRIALDAGFTCPNRDGRISFGGCFYCGEEGARARYVRPELSVIDQLRERMTYWKNRGFEGYFLAYFQAYTNTYGDPEFLSSLYESVLLPGVVGVFIGTRPDCLGEDVLDVLFRLAQKTWVVVEVGVQTTNDATLRLINRGHDAGASEKALRDLGKRHIDKVVHVIGGLPHEEKYHFLQTVKDVQQWGCEGIKFHHLFVEKNTVFANWYEEGRLSLLSRETYIEWVAEALSFLDPGIVVHRLFGDCEKNKLIAPLWTLEKSQNIHLLESWMRDKGIFQGREAISFSGD